MAGRTHIVVDTDVLNAQSTTLARSSGSLERAAAAASGSLPQSAFGLLASGLLVPAVDALADQASRLLSGAQRVTAAMQQGVDAARTSFDQVETEAAAVMREYES